MVDSNTPGRVVVALTEGLFADTYELYRFALYDSGVLESLNELSALQVDSIAAALLPAETPRERILRLYDGIGITERQWLQLRELLKATKSIAI